MLFNILFFSAPDSHLITCTAILLPPLFSSPHRFQRISMEVSASSPGKNEELTLALRTWSRLEEETTGRLRNSTGGSVVGQGISNGNSKDRGEGVGIAERQREGLGLGVNGKRVGGAVPVPMGSTAVEVDNEDDDNDGRHCRIIQ
jgi:hypothetical protein